MLCIYANGRRAIRLMTQANLWQNFKGKIGAGGGLAHRVENGLAAGMPDVIYVLGGKTSFMELKFLSSAPVRVSSKVRLGPPDHIKGQLSWARRWIRAGGTVWWLAQIGKQYMLFDPRKFPPDGSAGTMREMRNAVAWCSVDKLDGPSLMQYLQYLDNGDRPKSP